MQIFRKEKKILVLYYTGGIYPIIDTIYKHLYSFRNYLDKNTVYVNVAYGIHENILKKINFDIIIFHTIFLGSMRWDISLYNKFRRECHFIRKINCIKIALPQDEFIRTDLLNDFINDFGITHVFTCAEKKDWSIIYNNVNRKKVFFKQILTGYIDEETTNKINLLSKQYIHRDIDIGYRAWSAEYWLGKHATHKVKVAKVFKSEAERQHYITDISLNDKDTFRGIDWFKFLLRCKSTIGVEGGASVLDKDGSIMMAVRAFMQRKPKATFEEVKNKYFKYKDNKLNLKCISPRHLEACITKTLQFLIEGKFNGILKPWKHYIPIKEDYSNVSESLLLLKNKKLVKKITENAYKDVVLSGRYTYKSMIKNISGCLTSTPQQYIYTFNEYIYIKLLNIIENINWLRIKQSVNKISFFENLFLSIAKTLNHLLS